VGSQAGQMPRPGGTPAPCPSPAVWPVLPGLMCKEASPRGATGPPVHTSTALVRRDLSQHTLRCGKVHFTCGLRGSGLGEGRTQAQPVSQLPGAGALPRPPPARISTLGEGGERGGKAEPSSLRSGEGTLRLVEARCKSECFALFYGRAFV